MLVGPVMVTVNLLSQFMHTVTLNIFYTQHCKRDSEIRYLMSIHLVTFRDYRGDRLFKVWVFIFVCNH